MPLEAVQNDGTLSGAANAIAAAREHTPPAEAEAPAVAQSSEPQRGANGQFQKPEAEKSAGTEQESNDTGDEDEDFLEFESEDPETKEKKSERHKLSDVWAGFRRTKDLEAELETAKKSAPMPEHFETALEETVAERTKYIQALSDWAVYNQPREPDVNLLNPESPNYNPQGFYQQKLALDEAKANQARVKEEIERVNKLNQEQQTKLTNSRLMREQAKVMDAWPELKDKAVAQKVAADLEKHFGIDAETLKSVTDHRFYALAKDALAHRAAKTAEQKAVKVVMGKPKLVRANARSQTNSKAAQFQGAMGKLANSHSVEDAASAIAALRS